MLLGKFVYPWGNKSLLFSKSVGYLKIDLLGAILNSKYLYLNTIFSITNPL
jgi:hypothetical protein